MITLLTAAGFLGLGCVLSGRAVAAAMHAGVLARAGVVGRGRGPDRPALDARRLARWAPAGAAAAGWLIAALPGSVAGLAAGAVVPRIWERRRAKSRAALLEDQLAEAVSSLAAGMRAGLSLTRAIAFAADEAEQPLAASLASVADRTDLGTPLDAALREWVHATASSDARLLAGVLDLHRRTGGELPSVLDGVASTLRERRAAAREVRALTAQARLSAPSSVSCRSGSSCSSRSPRATTSRRRSTRRRGSARSPSASRCRAARSCGSGRSCG